MTKMMCSGRDQPGVIGSAYRLEGRLNHVELASVNCGRIACVVLALQRQCTVIAVLLANSVVGVW